MCKKDEDETQQKKRETKLVAGGIQHSIHSSVVPTNEHKGDGT